MGNDNKKSAKNNKKVDGKFHSKHIKHDPNAESARAVFELRSPISERKKSQKQQYL